MLFWYKLIPSSRFVAKHFVKQPIRERKLVLVLTQYSRNFQYGGTTEKCSGPQALKGWTEQTFGKCSCCRSRLWHLTTKTADRRHGKQNYEWQISQLSSVVHGEIFSRSRTSVPAYDRLYLLSFYLQSKVSSTLGKKDAFMQLFAFRLASF